MEIDLNIGLSSANFSTKFPLKSYFKQSHEILSSYLKDARFLWGVMPKKQFKTRWSSFTTLMLWNQRRNHAQSIMTIISMKQKQTSKLRAYSCCLFSCCLFLILFVLFVLEWREKLQKSNKHSNLAKYFGPKMVRMVFDLVHNRAKLPFFSIGVCQYGAFLVSCTQLDWS